MPHGFWGCHFAKGGAVIPREFYTGVPNSAGYHILCDTGVITLQCRDDTRPVDVISTWGQWVWSLAPCTDCIH